MPTVAAVFAILGMALANTAIYIASLMYSLRIGATGGEALSLLAHSLGLALGVGLLPYATAGSGGNGRRFARPLRFLALCAILGAWLARLPGVDGWAYGALHTWAGTFGYGIMVPAAHALFFSVIPPGKRGVWYGAGVGAGFLTWRVIAPFAAAARGTPEAVQWYNILYLCQGFLLLGLALILAYGFVRKGLVPASPIPAGHTPILCPPARRSAANLLGAAALFFLAVGLLNAIILPAGPNPHSLDAPWPLTLLVIAVCPLAGRYADRGAPGGVRRVFLACSALLLLLPTLEAVSRSHAVYLGVISCASLAQFAMLMSAAMGLAALGRSARWYGAVGLAVWLLRIVAVFGYLLLTKLDGGSGLNVVLATVAAMLFYLAAWRLDSGGAAGPAVSPQSAVLDSAAPTAPDSAVLTAPDLAAPAAPESAAPAVSDLAASGHFEALPPDIFDIPGSLTAFAARHRLSERETQVLVLLVRGFSSKETAERLGVRQSTLRTMVQRLREKTGTADRQELVERALLYSD